MALNEQKFTIKFSKGVDGGRDPKLVIPSKFSKMDNMEWDKTNTVVQRPGFVAKTLTVQGTTPALYNIRRLHALGEEVLLEADSGMYSFLQDRIATRDDCGGGFIGPRTKTFERCQVDYRDITAGQRDQFGFDVCLANQSRLECWVWTESNVATLNTAVMYRVVDSVTQSIVQEGTVYYDNSGVENAFNPRVIERFRTGSTSSFYIYYSRSNGGSQYIKMKSMTIANNAKTPSALSSEVDAIGNPVHSSGLFDVNYFVSTDLVAIAYKAAALFLHLRSNSGSDGITNQGQSISAVNPVALSSTLVADGLGTTRHLAVCHAAGASVMQAYSNDVVTYGSALTTTITTQVADGRVAVIPSPFLNNQAMVFYDFNPYAAGEAFAHDVGYVCVDAQGASPNGESTYARSVVLAARPVPYTMNVSALQDIAVPVALLSNLQPTIFVMKLLPDVSWDPLNGFGNPNSYTSPRVLARIFPSECGSLKAKWTSFLRLPNCALPFGLQQTVVKVPFTKLGKIQLENAINITPSRCTLATLTFSLALQTFEVQRSLFLAGACPMFYDGSIVHEAGFQHYPEGISGVGGGAGALTAGASYGGIFVYEWEDAKGVLHRSAQSIAVSVSTGAATSITWKFPYLRITDKQGVDDGAAEHRNNVRIALYRTAANGTTYYREAGVTTGQGIMNRTSLNTVGSWISVQSDGVPATATTPATGLQAGEPLYTTGGGLEAEVFPSTSIACMHQNRIFMVTQEEQNWLQYTDEIDERFITPMTNEAYRLRIPPEAGIVVALGSLNGNLIVVGSKQIGFYYGEGPNRLGQQNGYSVWKCVSSLLGGLGGTQESIAITPEGMWFMSSQNGLRLLNTNLQISMETGGEDSAFLGREADNYFTGVYAFIQARSIPTKSQVRWYLGQTVVVWDYQQQQWSRFTNHAANGGSTSARGLFWHSNGSQLFASRATAGGTDAGTLTDCVVETAWISLAGLQGFQRVTKMMLLMRTFNRVGVSIAVGYDYNDTWITGVTASGTLFPFGQYVTSAAAHDTTDQVEHCMHKQTCEAVRFRFTFADFGVGEIELFRLTSMTLSVGMKKGLYKGPNNRI